MFRLDFDELDSEGNSSLTLTITSQSEHYKMTVSLLIKSVSVQGYTTLKSNSTV